MGRYRFIDPESVRIEISDGDWIEIPKELSIADDIKFGRARSDNDFIAMLAIMVQEWSFVDRDGQKMPVGPDTISHLDRDTAFEIASAVAKHYSSMKDQKKASRTNVTKKRSISSAG